MESDKESLSFGRYLQAIRLEKKISLEQVSQQTRIGLGNLLLLEQEDHEQLPAEVYVKGFLRSYAKAVGADGDARPGLVSRFDTAGQMAAMGGFASKMGLASGPAIVLVATLIFILVFLFAPRRGIVWRKV